MEENGKMVALKISPKIEILYGLGRQPTKLYKDLYVVFRGGAEDF